MGRVLLILLLCSLLTRPTVGLWKCAEWCNHFTCEREQCTDCRTEHGCGPGHENPPAGATTKACAVWCNGDTCLVADCTDCQPEDVPDCAGIQKDVEGCATWCNEATCELSSCLQCSYCSPAAGAVDCADWCVAETPNGSPGTCTDSQCRNCAACATTSMANEPSACVEWCVAARYPGDADTCGDSHCKGCEYCSAASAVGKHGACAAWCKNDGQGNTCGDAQCAACSVCVEAEARAHEHTLECAKVCVTPLRAALPIMHRNPTASEWPCTHVSCAVVF